jgi:replicative DNA helicase
MKPVPLSEPVLEISLLACLLTDPAKIPQIRDQLSNQSVFVNDTHRLIYEEILRQHDAGMIPDQCTLSGVIDPDEWQRMMALQVNPERVEQYAEQLLNLARRRALRSLGQQISLLAETEEQSEVAFHESVGKLTDHGQRHVRCRQIVPIQQYTQNVIHQYSDRLDRHLRGEPWNDSIPTGITVTYDHDSNDAPLDEYLLLEPGTLTIYAARPSVGKTVALGMTALAAASAVQTKCPTLFCSLETSGDKLAMRFLANVGRIESTYFRSNVEPRRGGLHDITAAAKQLQDLPIHILTGRHSIDGLATQARLAQSRHGIRLLCIDYLQLVDQEQRRSQQTLAEALHQTAYGLQHLAKELNIPVVAACQLNRESEGDDIPDLRRMQGSSGIEQAADNIVILWMRDKNFQPNVVSGVVAKNRDGQASVTFSMQRQPWMSFEPLYREVAS